jgi:hypothetical protein
MKRFMIGLTIAAALAPNTRADPVYAVRPLDGYVCMNLNLSEAQLLDFKGPRIPILVAPRPDAAVGTLAAAVVFAKAPPNVVDGYTEVLQLTGKPGWIETRMIVPYHSVSNPYAHCTPSLMSNGRIGIG